ncbi:MAG TPA: M48 family metalloprotease [Kofleriaceae bacterium]|nr:M48 family metalloprotease [Kofleriaceae bacterium]
MVGIDFDFVRYVNYRKGQVEQRERDGAAYAYSGERKLRRALTSARPVLIAIEATTRLWKSKARRELLARSTVASDARYTSLYRAAHAAGEALGLDVPGLYVAEGDFPAPSATLGTDEDTVVVVARRAAEHLSEPELVALVGHELGHVQNNHVLYSTALFYLRHEALFFVRWVVQPAIMALKGWARRAEVTCDRASLIAARDIDVALSALVKATLDDGGRGGRADDDAGDDDAPDAEARGVRERLARMAESRGAVGRAAEIFRANPFLPKRARAMEVFAQSLLYHKLTGQADAGGLSSDEVDSQVATIMSVFA